MKNDQVDIIIEYLKIETNYAVIINGKYGVGKTHFFKNELAPRIEEVSLAKDDRKKFTPIHISLFGYKSLEEIQTAIFLELFPILKSKGLKLAAGIGKSIIRGIAQFNKLGDIDKYFGDINQDSNDWLKYDELVICFDDLDRKSEALDLRDIFGFINSLVENQGAKILLIANEEQLLKDKNYSSVLREKVIGVSILFAPNLKDIFNQIITTRYSSAQRIYFDFLVLSEDVILNIIELNQNNFRNVIFFLEHFKSIFYHIEHLFSTDKDFSIQKSEKLSAILDFTLAIAFEYKLGLMNSTNMEDVRELGENTFDINLFLGNSNKSKENADELDYIDLFKKKYFPVRKYFFFKSIFDYITGTKSFNIGDLKLELDGYFVIKNGEVSEQDEILNKLGYLGCLKLTDKDYREFTLQMLNFVDNGKYQLQQYVTVFHYATRFDNVLKFNINKLKKRFFKGIKNGLINYKYNPNLDLYISVSHDTEFKNDVIEIMNYCIDINNSLNNKNKTSNIEDLFNLFQDNFDTFIENVLERNNEYNFLPFWLEFNFNRIIKTINKLDGEQIWKFAHYFRNRYRRNIYEKLYPEKEFIINLIENINKPSSKRKKKSLHNASLNYLTKCLNDCLNNFPVN